MLLILTKLFMLINILATGDPDYPTNKHISLPYNSDLLTSFFADSDPRIEL